MSPHAEMCTEGGDTHLYSLLGSPACCQGLPVRRQSPVWDAGGVSGAFTWSRCGSPPPSHCNGVPHGTVISLPPPSLPHLSWQDDPSAPHKLQDSLKSCLKDEEPFNIHNSTSPKHDGKGEQDSGELNCLQNNLT